LPDGAKTCKVDDVAELGAARYVLHFEIRADQRVLGGQVSGQFHFVAFLIAGCRIGEVEADRLVRDAGVFLAARGKEPEAVAHDTPAEGDRKSTRLNSSHLVIS